MLTYSEFQTTYMLAVDIYASLLLHAHCSWQTGSGSFTVAGCRPLGGRQVPAGAGAVEPEKRASPAPVVSVREERRREKNGSGEQ